VALGCGLAARRTEPPRDVTDVLDDTAYDVRARWWTNDNWSGAWAVRTNVRVPAGATVASDTLRVGGQKIAVLLQDLEDASA
jgi:hypothetical protein